MKAAIVILAIVVLGAGGAGAYYLVNQNIEQSPENTTGVSQSEDSNSGNQAADEENDESTENEVAAIVEYDGNEFSPASVTVEAGSTVRFVNNGTRTMWVASDDHPAHTDLPEFDNKGGVGPGETYEFTFDTEGTWGYHDHLSSSAVGTVEVVTVAE